MSKFEIIAQLESTQTPVVFVEKTKKFNLKGNLFSIILIYFQGLKMKV